MDLGENSASQEKEGNKTALSGGIDWDSILDKLIQCKELVHNNPQQTQIDLPLEPAEISALCEKSTKLFLEEPSLLSIPSKNNIVVVGSLQGELLSLVRILQEVGLPPKVTYLFLGNVISTCTTSFITLCIILTLKLQHPDNVFMVRGREESGLLIPTQMSLHHQCRRQYNQGVLKAISCLFQSLPLAAVLDQKIFCVSGGLSPKLKYASEILAIRRPVECPRAGLICDLLFSSHESDTAGWAEAKRYLPPMSGVTYNFGGEIVSRFLARHNFDLMCNAGGAKVLTTGYEFCAWKQLVTIYSSPRESSKARNYGAVLVIDESLECSWTTIKFSDLMC